MKKNSNTKKKISATGSVKGLKDLNPNKSKKSTTNKSEEESKKEEKE